MNIGEEDDWKRRTEEKDGNRKIDQKKEEYSIRYNSIVYNIIVIYNSIQYNT